VDLQSPENSTSVTDNLTVSFVSNASNILDSTATQCSLYLNGVENETNSSVVDNSNTTLSSTLLNSVSYNWNVYCNDSDGNSGNSTVWTISTDYTTNVSSCGSITDNSIMTADITDQAGTCFTIDADNITFDCTGYTIDGDDTGTDQGIFLSSRTDVTVKNCIITDFEEGVYLNYSVNNFIQNTTTNSNMYGTYLYETNHTNVTDVTANSNSQYGVLFFEAQYNNFTNVVANSNTLDGIYCWFDADLGNCKNSMLQNITANSNSQHGVMLGDDSSGSSLQDITANSNAQYGIYISSNSNLTNANATSNGAEGVYVYSTNNKVINVTSNSNQNGIYVNGDYNLINDSTFSSNTQYGVHFDGTYNNITNSTIQSNTASAFAFTTENDNLISGNTICYNAAAFTGTPNSTDTITDNIFCVDLQSPANNTAGDNDTAISFVSYASNILDSTETQCSLYLNGTENQTSTSISDNSNTTFSDETLVFGNYNWNVYCNDSNENTGNSSLWVLNISAADDATTTTTTTTTTPSSASSTPSVRRTLATVEPETVQIIEILDAAIKLNRIYFKLKEAATNIEVTVSRHSEKPSVIDEKPDGRLTGEVYQYLEVRPINIGELSGDVAFEFRVDKVWIAENSISIDTVRLNRFVIEKWEALDTVEADADETHTSDNYYFYSSSPGFSYFAITGEKVTAFAAIAEAISPPELIIEIGEYEVNVWFFVSIALFIIILVLLLKFIFKKKMEKKILTFKQKNPQQYAQVQNYPQSYYNQQYVQNPQQPQFVNRTPIQPQNPGYPQQTYQQRQV